MRAEGPLESAVDGLRGHLLELIARLESHQPDAAGIEWLVERCARDRDALETALAGPAGTVDEGVARSLAEALRLNAVAARAAERRGDEMLQRLVRLRGARRRLGEMRTAEGPGGTCDVTI